MRRRSVPALAAALALLLTGCGSPAGPSAPETGSISPVYTDWSKLEPYQPDRGLYTRYYDQPVDRLLPVDGGCGGLLLPFVGALWDGGWARYGLATADGTVVCDPVYNWVQVQGDRLLLTRSESRSDDRNVEHLTTVAAADGSWVLPGEYRQVSPLSDGRLLLLDASSGFWLCDGNGALTQSPLTRALSRRWEIDWASVELWDSYYDGVGVFAPFWERGEASEERWLLNAVTGEIRYLPGVVSCWGWDSGDRWAVAYSPEGKCGYLDRNGDWAIPPQFQWANSFEGDRAEVGLEEDRSALIDRSGQVVVHIDGHLYVASDRNGTAYYLDRAWDESGETITAVYDSEGRLLPDHPLTGRRAELYSYAVTTAEDQVIGNLTVKDGLMTLWDYDGTVLGTVEGAQGLSLQSCEKGRAVLYRWSPMGSTGGVYDLAAGVWIIPLEDYSHIRVETDGTDTVYDGWRKAGHGYDILREDGAFLAHVDAFYDFTQGLLQCGRGDDSVWLDLNGEEVFRWPIQTNSD